jgi:hypothetical protein
MVERLPVQGVVRLPASPDAMTLHVQAEYLFTLLHTAKNTQTRMQFQECS